MSDDAECICEPCSPHRVPCPAGCGGTVYSYTLANSPGARCDACLAADPRLAWMREARKRGTCSIVGCMGKRLPYDPQCAEHRRVQSRNQKRATKAALTSRIASPPCASCGVAHRVGVRCFVSRSPAAANPWGAQ